MYFLMYYGRLTFLWLFCTKDGSQMFKQNLQTWNNCILKYERCICNLKPPLAIITFCKNPHCDLFGYATFPHYQLPVSLCLKFLPGGYDTPWPAHVLQMTFLINNFFFSLLHILFLKKYSNCRPILRSGMLIKCVFQRLWLHCCLLVFLKRWIWCLFWLDLGKLEILKPAILILVNF